MTVSWCGPNGRFERRIATLRPFESSSTPVTGDVLRASVASFFAPLLAEGQDVTTILNSVTTDTAGVPMSAFKDRPDLRMTCICHAINLVFSDLLSCGGHLQSLELQKLVRDIKAVLVKFAKSSKVRRAYAALWARLRPDEQPLQPIYDIVTRWSSTFHMIVRFMCMWPVLCSMPADQLHFGKDAEDAAWTDLRGTLQSHISYVADVAALLAPFFDWIEFFQANTVTASFVCQAATELCDGTEAFSRTVGKPAVVRDIARAVHAATVARLGSYVNVRPGKPQPNGDALDVRAAIAQLADPRTCAALAVRLTGDEKNYLELGGADARSDIDRDGRFVRRYVFGKKTATMPGGLFAEIERRYAAAVSARPASADYDEYGVLDTRADSQPLYHEIAQYVANVASRQICCDQEIDVLELVTKADYQARYPQWAAIQASVLSSSPTSAEPERVFKLAATIESLRRNRLSPAMLEAHVLLTSDSGLRGSRVTGPSRLWRHRVAPAIALVKGMSRNAARAVARALPPDTPLDQLSVIVEPSAEAANAGDQPQCEAVQSDRQATYVDEDDEDDVDDGEVMQSLLDAGAKVADDGSLVLDLGTISVLEGDDVVPDLEVRDDGSVLDAAARDAACVSVLAALDRRVSARLAVKPRRSWDNA